MIAKQFARGMWVFSSAGYGISGVALAGLVLSGCGNGTFPINTNVLPFNSYESKYADKSDVCYPARQPLIDSGNVFSESMITGALVGGAAGAAVGAATSKNQGQGAVVGGMIGIAAGLTAGYLHAKQEQAKTRAELLASIDADASRDNRQLVTGSNAIANLTRCRQNQIAAVERNYRAKAITGAQARQQLQDIETSVHADNALIGDVLGEAVDRSKVYVQARTESGGTIASGATQAVVVQPGQYVSTVNANVRGAPSTSGKTVDTLHTGETVSVVSDAGNGWVSISHNGVTGFVASRLLVEPSSAAARQAQQRGGVAAAAPSATGAQVVTPTTASASTQAPTVAATTTNAPATPPSAAVTAPSATTETAPDQAPASAASAAPPASAGSAPPPATVAPAAAPASPPPPVVASDTPASAPSRATNDNGTATFVRTTEEAEHRQQAHKQVESELQTRINSLPTTG
jgi:uncharacterized protein YgiM (DUF1202 family)